MNPEPAQSKAQPLPGQRAEAPPDAVVTPRSRLQPSVTRLFALSMGLFAAMTALMAGVLWQWTPQLTRYLFIPSVEPSAQSPLVPASYLVEGMWLTRPGPHAQALAPVAGWTDAPGPAPRAPVFFIHTTSTYARGHWNDSLLRPDASARDLELLALTASPFARAPLWAPRYRQAVAGAFLDDSPASRAAIDLAYGDVRAAFSAFLSLIPPASPFVIAGHGQGALLGMRLIADEVANRPVAARLVAAYLPGWPFDPRRDPARLGMPACSREDQPGCLLAWMSYAEPADPALVVGAFRAHGWPAPPSAGPILCVNPLTGGGAPEATATANRGTLVAEHDGQRGAIAVGLVPARCAANGLLLIGRPPRLGHYVLPGNAYHLYDVAAFWANLRSDVAARELAWRRASGRAPA